MTKRWIEWSKTDWGVEFDKKVGNNFNKQQYTDVIMPIAFNDIWVLMIWKFEARLPRVI